MEWLKDKKNLPIVAGLAGVVLLVMVGLILFELGVFPSGSSAPPPAAPTPVASVAPGAPSYPGGSSYPGMTGYPGAAPSAAPGLPKTASAIPGASAAKSAPVVNPMVGADPFALPGTGKALIRTASLKTGPAAGTRVPLNAVVSPYDLFAVHAPKSETPPPFEIADQPSSDLMLADTRVSGIVNADDGIFAIVEVNGNSQTVKPGDKLLDGSKVASIQATGITLHTPSGGTLSLPLSAGVPAPPANAYGYGGGGGYPGGGGGGDFGGGGGYPGG